MTDPGFTPLFNQPPGAAGADSLKVVPAGGPKTGFQPLTPASATAPAPIPQQPCAAQPVITVKKDKDRVTRICVQCACGQVVELECQY